MARFRGSAALAAALFLASACVGNPERPAVLSVAARNLRCPRSEMDSVLNRETPQVREYLVGCDFAYTKVHCSGAGCVPAKPRPPCFGGGCFEEDPVTLEWTLEDPASPRNPSRP